MSSLKMRWLTYAISGLICFGFGLSLTGEAIIYKLNHPEGWGWVAYGTIALVVTNSGLCLFGQGVVNRVKMLKEI